MAMDRRMVLAGAATLGAAAAAGLASPAKAGAAGERMTPWPPRETFKLWPGLPPGVPGRLPPAAPSMNGPKDRRELWLRGVAEPTLSVYRPVHPNGIGVMLIPGGGYNFVSVQNEGMHPAHALTAQGFTAFVLNYRLPGEGWENRAFVPLQDAQRAMRLIRRNSPKWRVQPGKLAVLGFSAGGHLAATLMTLANERLYELADDAERFSPRPECVGLAYAVTTLTVVPPNSASRANLLGPDPTEALINRLSPDRHVTAQTPPLFLAHALDDPIVPVDMSLAMLAAARGAKVPVEAHFYEHGGHGFGIAPDPKSPPHGWMDLYMRFVARHLG